MLGGRLGALSALTLLVVVACGSSAGTASSRTSPSGSGSAGAPDVPTSLRFEPSSTLTLAPGERRTLQVVASPAARYHVRFALLGDPANAALDYSEVDSDAHGVAEVGLTAPTSPATFRIRASVGTSSSADAAVSVSSGGFVTLTVHPDYGGSRLRAGDRWVASVRAGADCASLTGTPPPDGDLKSTSTISQNLFFKDPVIGSVPVGLALAVTVRVGHFAGGCADVQTLLPNQPNSVVVPVADRPMQLDQTDLGVELGIDPSSPAWAQAVSAWVSQTTNAMVDGQPDDVVALLDAMQTSLGQSASAAAFSQARTADGWDAVIDALLGAGSPHAIRTPVKSWLAAGATTFGGPSAFVGHLDAQGQSAGKADFTLSSVAGLAPGDVGAPTDLGPVSWTADPGDTVLLGAQLTWVPSKVVAALALPAAQKDVPTASSVPDALATQLNCTAIGTALAGSGANQGEAYPGCDANCAAALCENGLMVMWNRARDSGKLATATLDISATGSVDSVDDVAVPQHFAGTWVGKLSVGQLSATVGGPATGYSSPSPP